MSARNRHGKVDEWMPNPNEVNEKELVEAKSALENAVKRLWQAGADFEDIDEMFNEALEKSDA